MVERKIFSQIHQEIRTDLKEEVARTHYCDLGELLLLTIHKCQDDDDDGGGGGGGSDYY